MRHSRRSELRGWAEPLDCKNMVKYISISILVAALLVAASIWSYERGMAASDAIVATNLMVAVQRQKDCFKSSDQSCAAELNKILAAIVAAQLRRSDIASLSEPYQEEVGQFLQDVEVQK